MTKDLGVWKAEDCALVLIDYQREMFEVIRSETSADLVELHARLLARTARAQALRTVEVSRGTGSPGTGGCGQGLFSPYDARLLATAR